MGWFLRLAVIGVSAGCAWASGSGGSVLEYQLKVQRRSEPVWVESRFRVITSPGLVVRQRVHRPRMGTWRIEAEPGSGAPLGAALLAKAASLMYFSGPVPGLVLRETGGKASGRLWQAPAPPGVAAYVYLTELAPNLLALSYLSASLRDGDVAGLEIHLLKAELGANPAPVEEGTVLLRTLGRWSAPRPAGPGPGTESLTSERID